MKRTATVKSFLNGSPLLIEGLKPFQINVRLIDRRQK